MKHNWYDIFGGASSGDNTGDNASGDAQGGDYAGFADTSSMSFDGNYAAVAPLIGTEGSTTNVPMALYLIDNGATTAISPMDIFQGQIGDCFLLSSIGEIALTSPSTIQNMITQNANGTETVKLYALQKVTIGHSTYYTLAASNQTVTNSFASYSVDNYASVDVVGGVKEIWPQVLEKAFAQLGGGYSSISNGGSPVWAMEELTGKAATWYSPSQFGTTSAQIVANFNSLISANDMIVLDTSTSGNSTYNLVGNHAYMFDGLVTQGGTTYVKALNPWGVDEPNLIPVTALKSAFVEVDVGHV
jgi:hypothetical protein